jgi:hypothetical protein
MTISERPTRWLTFAELLKAPISKTIINEVDFEIDFEIAVGRPMTASERAQQRWFKEKDDERK